jgi:glycosyltransferase involved in cell wall biosynthesis
MISILMPIYNGIEFIEDSVSSIINQTFEHWELIIGINGHPPLSEVYFAAKQYELLNNKIKVLDLSDIKGKSNALNVMVQYCKYDYVALLDVDDMWLPNKLMVQSHYLNDNDIIGTKCVYFGESSPTVPEIPEGDLSNFNFFFFNPMINSSAIIRKELCKWNPVWDGVEDYDLWLHLKKSGKQFYNCRDVLVKHRIHRASAFNAQGNNVKVVDLKRSHLHHE